MRVGSRLAAGGGVWSAGYALAVLAALLVGSAPALPLLPNAGYADVAALFLLPVAVVATLGPGMMVKNFAAAAFGVLLGTVGIEGISGSTRYVFQQPQLWDGLPVVVVALGLFVLPELLDRFLSERRTSAEAYRGALALSVRVSATAAVGAAAAAAFLAGFVMMTNWLALPIMLVFLGVGIIMKWCGWGWSRLPLLTGLFYGPFVEQNFLSGRSVLEGTLGVVARPTTFVAALIITALIYLSYRSTRVLTSAAADASSAPPARGGILLRLWRAENLPVLLTVGGGLAFFAGSLGFSAPEAWLAPRCAAGLAVALALLQLGFNLRGDRVVASSAAYAYVLPGIRQAVWFGAAAYVVLPFVLILSGEFLWPLELLRRVYFAAAAAALAVAVFYRGERPAIAPWRIRVFGLIASIGLLAFVLFFLFRGENYWFLSYPMVTLGLIFPGFMTIIAAATLAPLVFHLRAGEQPMEAASLDTLAPTPWTRQTALSAAGALALFLLLTGVVGLPWGAMALAGAMPLLLAPAGFGMPWRALASLIAMGLVAVVVALINWVLFVIWPEAALFEWLGERVF